MMKTTIKLLKLSPLILLPLFMMTACSKIDLNGNTIKVRQFRNNVSFLCATNQIGNTNARLVQKSNGWSLYKNKYFKKGEIFMNIMMCTPESEIK